MGWLRLVVSSMIRSVICEGIGEFPFVHFVLDESVNLGVLDAVEDLVDKHRKYRYKAYFSIRAPDSSPNAGPRIRAKP